ncbi:MAG: hypothetical protein K1X89_32080, partial [Myxococcaceae bacterium]|nr:hypothetical protein [Myxococcaceae bacterium]
MNRCFLLVLALAATVTLLGCGAQGRCNPLTCGGCCDATSDRCEVGNTVTACGAKANWCLPCASFESCVEGACVRSGSGGGAGGGGQVGQGGGEASGG